MQPRFGQATVDRYLESLQEVDGWLDEFSARAIAALSQHQVGQAFSGNVAEIGIHHGKLFLVLYLTSGTVEKAIAIDVFAAQHLNVDQSGAGDKDVFLAHVKRWREDLDGVVVIEESSLDLSAERLRSHGAIRLFSIDGSHTEEATTNDIRLAEGALSEQGIVVMDDWPQVSVALGKYLLDSPRLVPFAITPGKVFMARPRMAGAYREFLAQRFSAHVEKTSAFYGHEVRIVGTIERGLRYRLGRTLAGRVARTVLRPIRNALFR